MAVDHVELSKIDNYFSKIIDYATNPLMPCYLDELNHSIIKELPKNIWFMIIPTLFDEKAISLKLLDCAVINDTDAKIVMPKDIVTQNAIKISYNYLMDNLRDSSDQYYVKEELWKKVDQLEAYVNERVPFTIDNRVFRQLERYSTMYLMGDGNEDEAIDCLLSSKLLVKISKLVLNRKNEDDEGIFALCEKLFGLENLTKSKILLKHIEEVNKLK